MSKACKDKDVISSYMESGGVHSLCKYLLWHLYSRDKEYANEMNETRTIEDELVSLDRLHWFLLRGSRWEFFYSFFGLVCF